MRERPRGAARSEPAPGPRRGWSLVRGATRGCLAQLAIAVALAFGLSTLSLAVEMEMDATLFGPQYAGPSSPTVPARGFPVPFLCLGDESPVHDPEPIPRRFFFVGFVRNALFWLPFAMASVGAAVALRWLFWRLTRRHGNGA